jgi:hypothetical protein
MSGQFRDALQSLIEWLSKVEPTLAESSLLNGVFPEPTGGKDDLQFNLGRVVDSLTRIVETRTRRVSV